MGLKGWKKGKKQNDAKDGETIAIPPRWKIDIDGSGPAPFNDRAVLQLIPLTEESGFEVALQPEGEDEFLLLGSVTRESGQSAWSGVVELDDGDAYLAFSMVPPGPQETNNVLFGIVLALDSTAGSQDQGTWGAEEEIA